eukprot:12135241-Alexandrium_andersonii.AAC.1
MRRSREITACPIRTLQAGLYSESSAICDCVVGPTEGDNVNLARTTSSKARHRADGDISHMQLERHIA